MYKVLVTPRSFAKADRAPMEFLEKNGCEIVRVTPEKPLEPAELIPLVADVDAVIGGLDNYDRSVIEAAKKLRVISRYGVGYNNVDMDAAREKGVAVAITVGANERSVADLAITLMLNVARNIPAITAQLRSGEGARPMGVEMWGKTLGIVGLGRIGKGVARRAKGFNMKLLCSEMYPDRAFGEEYGVEYCELSRIIEEADFITVHVPLTPETKGIIGAPEFKKMKKTAVIVNTARGGIVDEQALYEALKTGEIFGAGLDVTECEPASDSPLLELPNCIITSHIGGYTSDAVNAMGMLAAENAVKILKGEQCDYLVK